MVDSGMYGDEVGEVVLCTGLVDTSRRPLMTKSALEATVVLPYM
jgi:hypothetical protein